MAEDRTGDASSSKVNTLVVRPRNIGKSALNKTIIEKLSNGGAIIPTTFAPPEKASEVKKSWLNGEWVIDEKRIQNMISALNNAGYTVKEKSVKEEMKNNVDFRALVIGVREVIMAFRMNDEKKFIYNNSHATVTVIRDGTSTFRRKPVKSLIMPSGTRHGRGAGLIFEFKFSDKHKEYNSVETTWNEIFDYMPDLAESICKNIADSRGNAATTIIEAGEFVGEIIARIKQYAIDNKDNKNALSVEDMVKAAAEYAFEIIKGLTTEHYETKPEYGAY